MTHADPIIPVSERLPSVGAQVLVVAAGFRCLGRLDAAGDWHHAAGGEKINETVSGWIEMVPVSPGPLPIHPPARPPATSFGPPPPSPRRAG